MVMLLTILICKRSKKIKISNKRRSEQSIQGQEIPINIVLAINKKLYKNDRKKIITNCNINADDIKRAGIILGPAESMLQGKMKSKNQTHTTRL